MDKTQKKVRLRSPGLNRTYADALGKSRVIKQPPNKSLPAPGLVSHVRTHQPPSNVPPGTGPTTQPATPSGPQADASKITKPTKPPKLPNAAKPRNPAATGKILGQNAQPAKAPIASSTNATTLATTRTSTTTTTTTTSPPATSTGTTLATSAPSAPRNTALPESPGRWLKRLAALHGLSGRQYSEVLLASAGVSVEDQESKKWEEPSNSTLRDLFQDAATCSWNLGDDEKSLYILHRLQGRDHATAEQGTRYGPLYLVHRSQERAQVQDLLSAFGISASPLCYPRKQVLVPTPMAELGKGMNNQVYKIRIDGKDWAWKPANPDALPGPGASWCGIAEEDYRPVESNMIAYKYAKALAPPDGRGCVVGETMVAIVNGEPGLLMEVAPGTEKLLGTHLYQQLLPDTTPGYDSLKRLWPSITADRKRYDAICKVHGVSGIEWNENDQKFYVTGVDPAYPIHETLFKVPSFLKGLFDLNLVGSMIGWSDSHVGNIFIAGYTGDPETDKVTVRMIDPDDSGTVRDYADMLAATTSAAEWTVAYRNPDVEPVLIHRDSVRHLLYFMTPPVEFIDQATADALKSQHFELERQALNKDMKGHYPQERMDAINRRTDAYKAALDGGSIEVVETLDDWLYVPCNDPKTSLAGRMQQQLNGSTL